MPLPLPLPFLWVVIPSVVSIFAPTIQGVINLNQAQTIATEAELKYKGCYSLLKNSAKRTSELAEEYGEVQIHGYLSVRKVLGTIPLNSKIIDKLELSLEEIKTYLNLSIDFESVVKSGGNSVAKSMASLFVSSIFIGIQEIGLQNAIKAIGVYGFKAVATKVAFASASAMASSTLIPTLVAPAMISMGFKFAGETEEILTEALTYAADMDIKISQINAYRDCLPRIDQRLHELIDVVEFLSNMVNEQFSKFNSLSSERQSRAAKNHGFWSSIVMIFQFLLYTLFSIGTNPEQTRQDTNDLNILIALSSDLVKILNEASVLDENGDITKDSVLIAKYKDLYQQEQQV